MNRFIRALRIIRPVFAGDPVFSNLIQNNLIVIEFVNCIKFTVYLDTNNRTYFTREYLELPEFEKKRESASRKYAENTGK
jgi:hypothetical protein